MSLQRRLHVLLIFFSECNIGTIFFVSFVFHQKQSTKSRFTFVAEPPAWLFRAHQQLDMKRLSSGAQSNPVKIQKHQSTNDQVPLCHKNKHFINMLKLESLENTIAFANLSNCKQGKKNKSFIISTKISLLASQLKMIHLFLQLSLS